MESYNSFKVARQQVLEAAKLLNLDDATTEFLSTPQIEVNFTIPVKMDTGVTKIFQAYQNSIQSCKRSCKRRNTFSS